jgi:hypothetical protein
VKVVGKQGWLASQKALGIADCRVAVVVVVVVIMLAGCGLVRVCDSGLPWVWRQRHSRSHCTREGVSLP